MIAIAQYFHYQIVETMPLERLEEFKDHHRLQVFYHKGCKCVQCGIEGTLLAVGIGRNSKHVDVYTDDFYPLTVDHIIPRSLGGPDHIDNLQPMCCLCNWNKGNGLKSARPNRKKYPEQTIVPTDTRKFTKVDIPVVGKTVYRKVPCKNKFKMLGKIIDIGNNPYTGKPSVTVKTKKNSIFHLHVLYYDEV